MIVKFHLSVLTLIFLSFRLPAAEVDSFDEVLERLQHHSGFMGSVLIQRGSETLFSRVAGFRDSEQGTRWQQGDRSFIGSVTKQMTAAAIMRLQEEGHLRTSDFLSEHFVSFPNGDKITIHHLLTHTSGLRNYTRDLDFSQTLPEVSLAEIIDSFKDHPLEFEPGSRHAYSNSGYALLGWLIEKYSGVLYGEYLAQEFFSPLGLLHTGYQDDVDGLNVVKGHSWDGEFHHLRSTPSLSWAHAAGGVYSTEAEMLQWATALRGGRAISLESYQSMSQSCVPDGSGSEYCYGLVKSRWWGVPVIWHNGGFPGFNAASIYLPEQDVDIIVLRNTSGGASATTMARHFAQVLLQGVTTFPDVQPEASVPLSVLQRHVGVYGLEAGEQQLLMRVTLEKGRLLAKLQGQDAVKLFPMSSSRFAIRVVEASVEFQLIDGQFSPHLTLRQNGQEIIFTRLNEGGLSLLPWGKFDESGSLSRNR